MSRWQQARRIFHDHIWEPLLVDSSDTGLGFARLIWFIWFGSLCLFTLYARTYSEPLSDTIFAQVTGILSAVAITCTLFSRRNPWRLHWLMLTLCCVVFLVFQRPAGFTPHGKFLRSFAGIKNGMTTEKVTSLMQEATVMGTTGPWSYSSHIPVRGSAAHQKWLHPGYSGSLSFSHSGPSFDGYYTVDFHNGRVVSTYCYND